MSDRRNELFTARPPPGPEGADVYNASTVAAQAPADLLDLVRAAEDEAKLGASGPPISATKFHAAAVSEDGGARPEEFVDVGDDALDVPPSLAPLRAATPGKTFTPARTFATVATPSASASSSAQGGERRRRANASPVSSIVLLFALTIGALALLAR